MDGEQRVENLRKMCARKLAFDHLNHGPDGCFMCVSGCETDAAKTQAKALAEAKLVRRGQSGMIEVVIAVGVKKAVGKNRLCQFDGPAKERLQAATGPCVAAGLDDVGIGKGRIKTARPARELR